MTLRHGLFVSGAAAGVTPPLEARLALAGLLSNIGLLSGGAVTGSSSGPNMQYNVAAGQFATARGNAATDGMYVFGNDGSVTVNSATPAPASGTRWDLVWVRHKNAFASDGFGDANSDPDFGVTVGTAGASPVKPYASVPAGALVLAEASVGTNIANASLATISQVAVAAVARGGITPAASSTLYPASPRVGQYVDDAALGLMRWNGTAWVKVTAVAGTSPWASDATGFQTITHGLPFTPQVIALSVMRSTGFRLIVQLTAITSTTFSVYWARGTDGTGLVPDGTGATLHWVAYRDLGL